MKPISLFCLFGIVIILSACSINTKFDDDEYRPVGASSPLNSETHTISESEKTATKPKTDADSAISGSTRYTRPGLQQDNLQASNSKNISAGNKTRLINKQTADKSSRSTETNIITQTINEVFNSRYGDNDTIIKISKTVQIHCNQTQQRQTRTSAIVICEYRFPQLCGAHKFSLVSNHVKQLLIFHDSKLQRNIIDTLSATEQSSPGLWDTDDYVSSELLSVNQLINNKTIDSNSLGWIMNVSDNEKAQLGRSYIAAIKDTSKCF